MSRPKHPGVPLPANCISRLRESQKAYDRDPGSYERRQSERKMEDEMRMLQEQQYQKSLEEAYTAAMEAEMRINYIRELEEKNKIMHEALKMAVDIINDSQGVAGYNPSGEVALWEDFEETEVILKALTTVEGDNSD